MRSVILKVEIVRSINEVLKLKSLIEGLIFNEYVSRNAILIVDLGSISQQLTKVEQRQSLEDLEFGFMANLNFST